MVTFALNPPVFRHPPFGYEPRGFRCGTDAAMVCSGLDVRREEQGCPAIESDRR